jgi:iron(III) transport system substrate-binding protein
MNSDPGNRARRRLLQAGLGLTLGSPWLAREASAVAPPDLQALHLSGADRQARLVEGAKKEGFVSFYSSLSNKESVPLLAAFEKKYGVPVRIWRALSAAVVQRAVTEARASRFTVDVFETNGPEMEQLHRENLLTEFDSPYLADLPPAVIPKHRQWVADRFDYYIVAYNTAKIRKQDLPTSIEGFINPVWKGRLGLEATDSEWMGSMVSILGQDRGMAFFKNLAALHPDVRRGHIVLAGLVAAGEIPVALAAYSANVESYKRAGAPIEWLPVDPVIARPQGLGIARNVRNPNAAMLFVDFMLSPEGQQIYQSLGRGPSSLKARSSAYDFKYLVEDPVRVIDEAAKWEKAWDELFVNPH